MANALYDLGREAFLKKSIGWDADNIKVAACKSTYTRNLATDQFLSDITAGAIIATSPNLGTKTTAAGVAGAANATIAAVPAGANITQLVIYKDTGSAATSPLIGNIDTATGLPFTPNGSDVVIGWDTGANKIFKL